ncbi:MAG: putative transposase [Myxococcota bacterium]
MGGRGRRHSPELRRQLIELVDDAVCAGARLERACDLIGISERTLTRWRGVPRDRGRGPTTAPSHTLTQAETAQILSVATQPEFRNLSAERVTAKLADKGTYICSERSLRRVLKREKLATYRQRSRPGIRRHKPREFVACKPLRILTWDITYLEDATVRGHFFFLYLFMDIWSRRIVGWEVHSTQSSELAAQLLQRLCIAEGVETRKCVLHSDNGSPVKGSTMLATMHDLGITKSFSRPQVSDDNAHVESLLRHLKYAPSYPTRGFDDLAAARTWVGQFVDWYNSQHLHSGIGYVTPDDRHHGRDIAILQQRRDLYDAARQKHPRRWTQGTKKWHRPTLVMLNPDRVVELSPTKSPASA